MFRMPYLIKQTKKTTFFPFYHAVSDVELMHLKHVNTPRTAAQFENDLDVMLKYFKPVDLQTALNSNDQNQFHVSFDNGLAQVYDICLPILERKGIPATIFVNSDFVDNADMMFRYKVSIIIEKSNRILNIKKNLQKRLQVININDYLLKLSYQDTKLINVLMHVAEESKDAYLAQNPIYATTSQLQTMQNKGFVIGANSASHPLFSSLNTQEIEDQIKKDTLFIQRNFQNQTLVPFAFPFHSLGIDKLCIKSIHNYFPVLFGSEGLMDDTFLNHTHRTNMELLNHNTDKALQLLYFNYYIKQKLSKNVVLR